MTIAQRHSRLFVLMAAALVLGAFLAVLTTWMTPASAFVCNPDTTFTLPAEPIRDTGANRSASTTTATVGDAEWTVVSYFMLPVDAYGGAGYNWYPFATSICDPFGSISTVIGDILLMLIVTVPATILGAITQFAFSTTFVNSLMPFMGEAVGDLERGVFRTWAPMMIAAVLITVMFAFARNRGQKGFGDLGWMVAVLLIMGMLASPVGIQLLEKVNQVTRNVATNAMYAGTTGGSTGGTANSLTVGMVDSLSYDAWAVGAVGDVARRPIPTELSFRERKNPFMVNTNDTVEVPVNIIPAVNPGAPTWGEAMRWTQTYTWAEMDAMASNSSLRCSVTKSQNMGYLSEGKPIEDSDSTQELCGFKWLLRAAMFNHLLDHHSGSYASAAGNSDRIAVTMTTTVSILPLIVMVLIVGFMVLLYQLQMLMYFVSSPVIALLALKSKTVGRRWLEQVISTLVKWVAAGFVMGLVLLVLGWTTQVVNDIQRTAFGIGTIAMLFVRGLITWLLVIGALIMFSKIQNMILTGVDLKPADSGKGKRAAGTAALVLGGAAMGVAGAGAGVATGVRAKAAMAGATRGALGRYGASAQLALGRAQRAGENAREKWEESQSGGGQDAGNPSPAGGPPKTPPPPPSGGPGGGGHGGGGGGGGQPNPPGAPAQDSAEGQPNPGRGPVIPPVPAGLEGREDVTDAWGDLMSQPDIQQALELTEDEQQQLGELAERARLARQASDAAEEAHAYRLREKVQEAQRVARTKVSEGVDPEAAEQEAIAEVLNDPEWRALEEAVTARRAEADDAEEALRKAAPDKVSELVEAMNSKDPEVLQVDLGLSEETMEKMARYRHAAQNATYESLPDTEGSPLAAQALARAKAHAAAQRAQQEQGEQVPDAPAADLPTQTLHRARQMGQANRAVLQETIIQERGSGDRGVRDAIREGVREGMREVEQKAPRVQPPPPPPTRRTD